MPQPLSRTPTLAELLNHAMERNAASLRVALPAKVVRYDSSKQVVDVEPQIKDRFEGADGAAVSLALPVVTNVPLMFPGAGSWCVTFPVTEGDTVLLVFGDRSIDAWTDQGGVTDPDDARRHHLTDAVAIPGLRHAKNKLGSMNTSVMCLGKDGESEDWVARATPTKDEISAVRDTLNSLVSDVNSLKTSLTSHVHPGVMSGASSSLVSPGLAALTPSSAPAAVGDVKSSTVKVKG